MKTHADRCVSYVSCLFYILTGFGFSRTAAIMSGYLKVLQNRYILTLGMIAAAGLILVYLPACIFSVKSKRRIPALCEPGRITKADQVICLFFLILLAIQRFVNIPVSFSDETMPLFWINLGLQVVCLTGVYYGFKRGGNRLIAVGASLAVICMPSCAECIYAAEPQNFILATFGVFTAFFASRTCKKVSFSVIYILLAVLLGMLQTRTELYKLQHSMTLEEYGILTVFYLIACLSFLTGEINRKQGCLWFGVPYILLFLICYVMNVPVQEQGVFHVLLGAAAGASISHILTRTREENTEERSRDEMAIEKMTAGPDENRTETAEPKRPSPGEYLENPLPVPKKHVKKEMDYGFEPELDQMKFDILVSDEDDFDLQ